ncbi:DUF1349 domain-containing protein [Paenibacillus tengchongensis]|uniref:DUF1349 domain-containing protein n=1 Tax=Paenibacillus tengchongensis TaxID=2608684 RepID=UPI0016520AEE|nr:DUF1349 domain-containing protein [Paenibacillus tengchongensis]
MKIVDWQSGNWTNEPVSCREVAEGFAVEAVQGSDYWQTTLYGFRHGDGHALLVPWEEEAAAEVSFSTRGFSGLYDQAGIMLWHSGTVWIKAGIEINDGVPHLGAVVTDGYSDWSLSPVPEWAGKEITLRASRMKDAVIIRARAEGEGWRTIRVACLQPSTGWQAGPMVCAPTRSGLEVTFTRWVFTAPDTDLHEDPPET